MERRKRREWEHEFVSEYCARYFTGSRIRYHIRLGTWPQPQTAEDLSEAERALLSVRMRWADALVLDPKRLTVLEGKLRPSEYLKGLGELQLYRHLVKHTPGLEAFKAVPVVGRLLISLPDPTVSWLARSNGLEVAVYQPTFWSEYLNVLSARERRAIRPEEAQLLEK